MDEEVKQTLVLVVLFTITVGWIVGAVWVLGWITAHWR